MTGASAADPACLPPRPDPRAMEAFSRLCGLLARWFRYRCVGYENIPREHSALLLGYHGRPAFDMFMLLSLIHRREGRALYGISHKKVFENRRASALFWAFGMYDGSDEQTRNILARGDLVGVLPGGTRECFRSSRTLYQLDWGRRRGYLRFALRHGLPIIPIAASGVDEFYRIYGDGYRNGMRFFGTDLLPITLPLGVGGVPFPLGLPRPVAVRQLVGPAIELSDDPGADPDDPEWLERAHERVTDAVAELLRRALQGGVPPADWATEDGT